MTDKQIIDGCDVSGCKNFYAKTKDCVQEDTIDTPCVDHPNCYYKQLKAKEQECETLASQLDFEVQKKECLEQECEELKKQLIKCDDNIIVDCEYLKKDLCGFMHRKKEVINGLEQQLDQLKAKNQTLKQYKASKQASYESMQRERNNAVNKNRELKQTLTEIKEIAENNKHSVLCFTAFEGDAIEVNNEPMAAILQKISECEVEDETSKTY